MPQHSQDIVLFSKTSRLWSTQPPIQWVPGVKLSQVWSQLHTSF